MNNQDQVPTIAELWGELQKEEKFLTAYTDLSKNDGWWIQPTMDSLSRFQSLRQQLVEWCKEVDDADRDTTKLWVCCNGDRVAIQTPGILEFVGSPRELRELGAACEFWAWELEQREKEIGNG